MEFRVEFDFMARVELFATWDWIADKSAEEAEKWLLGILYRIKTFRKFPHRNPVAREALISGIEIRELHLWTRIPVGLDSAFICICLTFFKIQMGLDF